MDKVKVKDCLWKGKRAAEHYDPFIDCYVISFMEKMFTEALAELDKPDPYGQSQPPEPEIEKGDVFRNENGEYHIVNNTNGEILHYYYWCSNGRIVSGSDKVELRRKYLGKKIGHIELK